MKVLFICKDSLIISPLFATYFNYLCESNALKVKVDFCGLDIDKEDSFDEELIKVVEEYSSKNITELKDFYPKKITPELVESASFIFIANDDAIKKKILNTDMISEKLIFPMSRGTYKFEYFQASDKQKMSSLIKVVEKEMFFLTEKFIQHQYII